MKQLQEEKENKTICLKSVWNSTDGLSIFWTSSEIFFFLQEITQSPSGKTEQRRPKQKQEIEYMCSVGFIRTECCLAIVVTNVYNKEREKKKLNE